MSDKPIFLKLIWVLALCVLGMPGTTALISAQNVEMPSVIVEAKWHPRGEGLLVIGRGSPGVWGMWLYDTDMQLVRMFPTENPVSADWSPDGTRLSKGREILDAQSLEVLLTLKANSGIGGWSPDGKQVLAWADDHHLGLFDSQTGELVRSVPVGEMIPDAVSWSPNGAYFALIQPIGTTDIISADDGRHITTIPMEYPIGLRWSPDSRYMAAGFLTIVEPSTPDLLPLALSPTVASVMVWEALTASIVQQYKGLLDVPTILRWHPQEPELAAGTSIGLVYTWNIDTGQSDILTTLGGLGSIEYSPFGGRMLVGASVLQQELLDSQRQALVPQQKYWSQNVVGNILEVLVPSPSAELLNTVETACVPGNVAQAIPGVNTATQDLSTYVEVVRQNADIPPGCKADLLAVANALLAQGQ